MKYNNIRSFNNLLQNSPTISKLYYKLQQIQQLNNVLTNLLPPLAAQNCCVSNLRDGMLILTTTSPVWNHQINFLKTDLINKLRNSSPDFAGITAIKVKTSYLIEELNNYKNAASTNNKSRKKLNISANSAKVIHDIADKAITYQPLANMLKNLCKE